MTSANRYFFRRFGLKIALLTAFASLETAFGLKHAMASLFAVSAAVSAVLALVQKDGLTTRRFSYWDESAGLLLIALLSSYIGQLGQPA